MTQDGKGRGPSLARIRKGLSRGCQWAFLASLSTLAACAVLSSETFESLSKGNAEPIGVSYALPMGLLEITLSKKEETAEFRIGVLEQFVPDPARRYLMRYHPMPNYKDTVEIKVHGNSLLNEIDTDTEDETDSIILELAKLARSLDGFQSAAMPTGFTKLANITIDPTNEDQVKKAATFLSVKARLFAQNKYRIACGSNNAKSTSCRYYERYSRNDVELIELAVEYPQVVEVATVPVDCSAGLCYRGKEPYVVRYGVDGVKGAIIVELPNRAPIVEIDITRAFFVQKVQKIQFDNNGFLWKANVKKYSELKAVATLPIEVIKAISDVLPLRLRIQQKQNNLAQARLAELEAHEKLRQTRREHD
jgi:hypothetical protein